MVAAQTPVMSRSSSSSRQQQQQQDQLIRRSPITTPVSPLSPKSSHDVSSSSVDDKRTEFQEEEANRIDEEELTKARAGSSADDSALRETGDHFCDARARGKLLQNTGRYREALDNYRVALQCKHKTFASEPKEVQATFGDILYDIGTIHWQSEHGNPEQSLEAFHFCLQVRRTCFGSNHPVVARTICMLASLHVSADDHECALHLLLEALFIFLTVTPDDHSSLFNVWIAIGNTQQALGFAEEADSSFQEAEQLKSRSQSSLP